MIIQAIGKVFRLAAFLILIGLLVAPAQAQGINIQLGGGEGKIRQRLANLGYREIQIVKSGFSKVRAEACRGAVRYSITVKRLGLRVREGDKVGKCRIELSLAEIENKLAKDGYTRIANIKIDDAGYVFRACTANRAVRLVIDRFGDIVKTERLGRCRRGVDYSEIRASLRDQGFNRIKLVEQTDRRFLVEACRRDRRFRLNIRPNGRIRRERRIGRCAVAIRPGDIENVLIKKGYNRISVTDRKLPGYRAEACTEDNKRMSLLMNRYGDIRRSRQIGTCFPPVTKDAVQRQLLRRGFKRIVIEDKGRSGFLITACLKLDKIEINMDRYGDVLERNVIGKCTPPPRLPKVIRDFEDEKRLSDVKVFVEGCRRGRLLRFEIDELGEVVERTRVGRCR